MWGIAGYEIDLIITSLFGHYLYALLWLVPAVLLFMILTTSSHYREADGYTRLGLWVLYFLVCCVLALLSHWHADYIGGLGI